MSPSVAEPGQLVQRLGRDPDDTYRVLSVLGPFVDGTQYIYELVPEPNPFNEESFTITASNYEPVGDRVSVGS